MALDVNIELGQPCIEHVSRTEKHNVCGEAFEGGRIRIPIFDRYIPHLIYAPPFFA